MLEDLIPVLVQNTGGDAGLAIYQLLSRSGDGQPGLELGNEAAVISPQPRWDDFVPSSVFTFNNPAAEFLSQPSCDDSPAWAVFTPGSVLCRQPV